MHLEKKIFRQPDLLLCQSLIQPELVTQAWLFCYMCTTLFLHGSTIKFFGRWWAENYLNYQQDIVLAQMTKTLIASSSQTSTTRIALSCQVL
jgi:hypothetical protein